MEDRDALIEEIAAAVEAPCITDICGVGAKRKRAREDARLRMKAREELRTEMGAFIRSFKTGSGNDPLMELERIAENGGSVIVWRLDDVLALYSCRYVTLDLTVPLSTNEVPFKAQFVATITETGRKALEKRAPTA